MFLFLAAMFCVRCRCVVLECHSPRLRLVHAVLFSLDQKGDGSENTGDDNHQLRYPVQWVFPIPTAARGTGCQVGESTGAVCSATGSIRQAVGDCKRNSGQKPGHFKQTVRRWREIQQARLFLENALGWDHLIRRHRRQPSCS